MGNYAGIVVTRLVQAGSRVAQPMPNLEKPIHYLDVFATPLVDKARKPDDFQPRVCITKAFMKWEISLLNRQAIQNFALALACEEKHVVNCIPHIKDMETRKEKRSKEREAPNQTSKMKSYKDYSWLVMTMEGALKSLKVKKLDKYLDNHRLSKQGKKDDKINPIMCNVLRENQNIIALKSQLKSVMRIVIVMKI